MKSSILLLAFAALAFTSCTSAYKTGQTPDDVYYSPVREQDEYVQVDKRDDRSYQGTEEYYEERYLRYRARSPYRFSALDDYYYNTPYAWHYGSYGGYNSLYNPYSTYHCWNNYYNPYYNSGVVIIKNPGNWNYYTPPSRPIAFNPGSYSTNPNSNNNKKNRVRSYNGNDSRYNNSNSGSLGGSVRRVFSNSNSSSNNSNNSSNNSSNNPSSSTPSRSYTPSSSSSSSSSGSRSSSSGSSSGGSISRPNR